MIGAAGFLVRLAVLSMLLGDNLWVVITTAAAGLLERITSLLGFSGGIDLAEVQLLALALVAIFVAFRPEWLATYSDRLYLRPPESGGPPDRDDGPGAE